MELTNDVFRKETCPWGQKAIELLNRKQISFKDHVFHSKDSEEEFKNEFHVDTTPQVFLDGDRVGGYEELAERFDEEAEQEDQSYVPVIAVFSTALLLALALDAGFMGFMGFAVTILACLKLMDLNAFLEGFKQYDLVTPKFTAYGKIYPFAELAVGIGALAGVIPWVIALVALVIGSIGGISVFKAVYIDKRDLNCACVGGNSSVPLGTISFIENAMMVLMGLILFTY